MFKILNRIEWPIMVVLLLAFTLLFSACNKDDEEGSNGTTQVLSFGPSPALRGGELKFIGTGLDKVTSIALPGGVEVSNFKMKTSELIIIDVPEETMEGLVTIKAPQGDIVTKTELGISEPISISSYTPADARPGDVVTINGDYLNLIEEVIFSDNKIVTEFESHSKTKIEVKIPVDAKSGLFTLSNGEEEPILVKSETPINIALPSISEITPATVKAGEPLTIKGANLDLTAEILFAGGTRISEFVSQTASELVVNVPNNAEDGKIKLIAPSSVEVESSASIILAIPTITSFTPNPGKNNGIITITGANLDLVSQVLFGGDKEGVIQDGRTATELKVKVPANAIDGKIKLNTLAKKTVISSQDLLLVKPTITSISPLSVNTVDQPIITITGTNLDIADTIVFGGNWKNLVSKAISVSENEIKIGVVPGSLSGKVKIITTNGGVVTSAESLTIVPDVPNVTVVPTKALIGAYMTIEGTNMDVPSEIVFPGNIPATYFGSKTSTLIRVFVPSTVKAGMGRVKFITSNNEIYESPELEFGFGGVDPIADPALIINDFEPGKDGHGLGWDNWGGNSLELLTSNPGPGITDNHNFVRGTKTLASWTWLWGCNHDQLPKPSVSKAGHVFKIDVYITTAPPAGAEFKFRFSGTEVSLGNLGASTTPGWVTLSWDLSDFATLPATIPGSGEWGLIYNGSSYDLTGFHADNFRFEQK